ncbi:MAG: PIN domain nuclease [Bryobacteraceae bacterium]|nr:PIN domain nuclease [Solibacteraceae bacterium]MCO5352406.1 PIN domain nuclease [Bryobacteraceae bacterium]
MILVDSGVWIDYFRGASTPQTELLDRLLGVEEVAIGDLILAEVLQGFVHERDFRRAQQILAALTPVELGGAAMALQSARNHRSLRRRGVTVRKTIDTLIATWCIATGTPLLHNDRDFDAFARHLGMPVIAA